MIRNERRARLILVLLLLTSLTLVLLDVRGRDAAPFAGVRTAAGTAVGPLQSAAATATRSVVDRTRAALGSGDGRVAELEQANAALLAELRTSELDRTRARELDDLLQLAGRGHYKVVPARVIAIGPEQGFTWTVAIDAGTRDGVVAEMTVLSGQGIVGRVTTASALTSTVLLAIDPMSSMGVRLEASMEIGYVDGTGDGALGLTLLDSGAAVKSGDRLVTFGSSGDAPYVQGVPVGEVTGVDGRAGTIARRATVRPFVDFTVLDLVAVVVQPPREDPRDAVLPPVGD